MAQFAPSVIQLGLISVFDLYYTYLYVEKCFCVIFQILFLYFFSPPVFLSFFMLSNCLFVYLYASLSNAIVSFPFFFFVCYKKHLKEMLYLILAASHRAMLSACVTCSLCSSIFIACFRSSVLGPRKMFILILMLNTIVEGGWG